MGPNDKATKKVQRTEAARRCASFFGRGRFSLGTHIYDVVRAAVVATRRATHIKLELRLETP